ncbi:MAG: LysR family transcriptional regulator [Xanthobacteraceae bacterium]|nr:LysR family transcriptional regulator [Xanthobacteraceae bacterium]QYK45577.1 MAG: LysR family transcriptional regulator [Xanthobacteraceae bacterium]HMN51658.1 LysR family transcriptional regulator [Xanthobacteraceae bacterium]
MADIAWDEFRLVKAIAETKSLAGAADTLGINHSTVFRRLGALEKAIGARLFERSRTGYAPTAAGEKMVELAFRIADDVVDLERKITGQDLRPSGELRVTTNDTLLVHLLSDVFVGFRKTYPEINLDIVVANESLNLSKRDADIAIRATDRPPEALIGRRLASIRWGVFAPAADKPKPFLQADARRYHWIGLSDGIGGPKPNKWLMENAGPDRIVYKINTVLGLAEAVAAGGGHALLPCFIGAAVEGAERVGFPEPDIEAGLWLLTHPDLKNSARVRAFLDYTAQEVGKRRHIIECADDPVKAQK